jgi:hypothetical protein
MQLRELGSRNVGKPFPAQWLMLARSSRLYHNNGRPHQLVCFIAAVGARAGDQSLRDCRPLIRRRPVAGERAEGVHNCSPNWCMFPLERGWPDGLRPCPSGDATADGDRQLVGAPLRRAIGSGRNRGSIGSQNRGIRRGKLSTGFATLYEKARDREGSREPGEDYRGGSALALIGVGKGEKLNIRDADVVAEAVIDKIQIQQVLLGLMCSTVEVIGATRDASSRS